jgi:hypothetical protein
MISWTKYLCGCLLLLLVIRVATTKDNRPVTFDLSAAFSDQQTSDSVWQYGYSETSSLAPDQFRRDSYFDNMQPICFWHPLTNNNRGPGYYPYVAYNRTDKSQIGSSNGWAARGHQVAMEASNSGQYSLVRFISPFAGTYEVSASFEGIHFGLSSTDVHVLHNSDHVFDADIQGYGGDPAFHRREGTHPTASYKGVVHLDTQDVITFAVGYGTNKTNYGDTTGLFVRIVLLPPSTK